MKKIMQKSAWWLGTITVGIVLGVSIQLVSAWIEPLQTPPDGNVAGPLTTGNGDQTKAGGNITLGNNGALITKKVTDLDMPINGKDATNKDYVDAAVGGGGGKRVYTYITANNNYGCDGYPYSACRCAAGFYVGSAGSYNTGTANTGGTNAVCDCVCIEQ